MANEIAVRNAVLAVASENSSLLVRLSSTSEAPSIFRAQLTRVSSLQDALTEQTKALEKLTQDVAAHSKKHKKFRDSVTRRFLYRATHMLEKFDIKAMKAEREYFAALGEESKAKERRAILERDYEDAVKVQGPLEEAAKEHEDIHGKIDRLYESLFAGPTPGFPYEDEREEAFYSTRTANEATKERILAARRAVRLLNLAQVSLKRAQRYLESAQRTAEDSILFFDDTFQSLRYENDRIAHILLAIDRAEEPLGPLSPEMSSSRLALIFQLGAAKVDRDTLYSRDLILSAVASAQDELLEAEPKLKELIEVAKQRERDALSDIKGTARQLEDTRQELQQIRQGIFEKVAGFGEAAPAYNECCDRADSYCAVPEESHEDEVGLGDDPEVQEGDASHHEAVVDTHDPPAYESQETVLQPVAEETVSIERPVKA